MDNDIFTLDIPHLRALLPRTHKYEVGNGLLLCQLSEETLADNPPDILSHPIRMDCYCCFFCIRGEYRLEINLKQYHIKPNTLFVNIPGNILKSGEPEVREGTSILLVLISKDLMHNVRIDFNKVFQESLRVMDSPCIELNPEQLDLARQYLYLAQKIVDSDLSRKEEEISGLLSSLTNFLLDIWSRNISAAEMHNTIDKSSLRLKTVLDRFLSLASANYARERGMAFYAEKMNLTPKYLSKLVRQASGRSAPEWIDEFVILDAKNMLRYSDKTIKEIVYQLNFPNQSVFYKFFKAHTGMTPSEYRHG